MAALVYVASIGYADLLSFRAWAEKLEATMKQGSMALVLAIGIR